MVPLPPPELAATAAVESAPLSVCGAPTIAAYSVPPAPGAGQ